MGNVCSYVREGIDYVLRYILPKYASYFPGGYINRIEDDFVSRGDIDNAREIDRLLTNDEDHIISIGQGQNCDRSNQEAARNAGFLQGVVSDFFNNYNFQIQVLNGRNYEKNVNRKDKHVKKTFLSEQTDWNHLNRDEALNKSRFEKLQWNIRQKDLISGLEDIEVNGPDSSSKCQENAESPFFSVQNDGKPRNGTEEFTYGTENLESEPSNMEVNKKSKESHRSSQRRKYGAAPTEEILRQRQKLVENFSRISSLKNTERFNDQSIGDDHSNDRQGCEVTEHNVRKVSLLRMHSGCHYSVNEGYESVELTDYSRDSPALHVDVETFRNLSHPNLGSGGVVVFEELSKHLSLPDYYAEDPIVYNELPKDLEFPRTSPMKLPSQQPLSRPASFSGGGIVPANPRRVSLPVIFPQRNPLLQPVTTQRSTGSSNFGGLVTPEKDQHKIFSDLISQSRRFDDFLVSQVVETEDLNEDRREVPCHASESEPSTPENPSSEGDLDKKRHLGSF